MTALFTTRLCTRRVLLNRRLLSSTISRSGSAFCDFSAELSRRQPTFSVLPNDIRILAEPKEFYASLLDMIQRAHKRIFLSSLYIGSGETELVKALGTALQKNPALTVHLQLDLNRSTRPGNESTARLLLPLIQAYPDRISVYLFRSPSLRGLLAKIVPPRFNEGWGTWHAKIYGADNDIIISGANLNSNYFTDRRDRYLTFTNHEQFANYCRGFLEVVSRYSFRLLPASDLSSLNEPYSYNQEDFTVSWSGPNAAEHPHYFNGAFEMSMTSFQASQKAILSASPDEPGVKLLPIVQGGQFNLREEEATMKLFFEYIYGLQIRPRLDLTSGYFNLYKPYQDLLLGASNVDSRVIAASPKANGFYGSRGISSRIPEGYTLLERRFMDKVKSSETNIELNEWEKEGWTYHAKGIWLSPDLTSDPILTLFGSTNLNARSAHIDTDLSFMLLVPSSPVPEVEQANLGLRRHLGEEVRLIREHTKPWAGYDRSIRPATPFMLKIVEDML